MTETNHVRKVVLNAPPPYLNSSLHIGHLYSFSTLTPFYNLVDYQSRQSHFKDSLHYFNGLNMPKIDLTLSLGVDVNGLPLTRAAKEKSLQTGVSFEKECENLIHSNSSNIQKIYSDLGLYNLRDVKEYTTADKEFDPLSQDFLSKMIQLGFMGEVNLPHRYCKNCESFLSNSETDLVPEPGARYKLLVHDKQDPTIEIPIMTTRPEFLPGVCAFAAHPTDQRYLHLKDKVIGFKFEGRSYYAPVLFSNYVHPSVGSGLVYITRWCSVLDLELCRDLRLTGSSSMYTSTGQILPEIKQAHDVSTLMELKGKILSSKLVTLIEPVVVKTIRHTERGDCKSQVLFLASPQVALVPDEKTLLEFIQYIKDLHIPVQSFKNQLLENVKSLREWCISRANDYYSFNYKFNDRVIRLDTWVISSLTHYIHSNVGDQVWRIQGSDIIRTWLLYSLFVNFILKDKSRDITSCFVHKMVVDENHQKISKSRNNGPSAKLLLSQVEAPPLRYYFCQKPFSGDFSFNMKELNDNVKFFTKVKNLNYKIGTFIQADPLSPEVQSQIWSAFLDQCRITTLETRGLSPVNRLIHEFDLFFSTNLLEYSFTRILNKLKTFVYAISSNIDDPTQLLGHYSTDSKVQLIIIKKLWALITNFLSCF